MTAKIGSEVDLGAGFAVALAWNYQGFRHEIYRNDILPRFGDENCTTVSCRRDVDRFSGHSGGDSWTWVSAQLSYALTERVGILLDLEGAGSRDWQTASLGLRCSF